MVVAGDPLALQKKKLRGFMRRQRVGAALAAPQAATKVRDVFLSHCLLPPQASVAFYMAQGDEMSVAPLAQALAGKGHPLCLPVSVPDGAALVFRSYCDGDGLQDGVWRIPEPLPLSPEIVPDVLLIPLLAFNRAGYRLGQGGGFYDRTLTALRAQKTVMAIGIGYEAQEVEALPVDSCDAALDAIVTETSFIIPRL